jgi:hypothetical protein
MADGINLWFESIEIPTEYHNVIEYEISPFCSLVYNKTLDKEYIDYIDLATGDEYEEELTDFAPREINGVFITMEYISEFYNLVMQHRAVVI